MTVKTFEVPVRLCLGCGAANDRTTETSESGRKPEAGDATICVSCGQASIFNEDLSLRLPTEEENQALARNEHFQKIRKAWDSIPETLKTAPRGSIRRRSALIGYLL